MTLQEQMQPLYDQACQIALDQVEKIFEWSKDKNFHDIYDDQWRAIERGLGGSVEHISIEGGVLLAHISEAGWEWSSTRAIPVDETFADRTIARLQSRIDRNLAIEAEQNKKKNAAKEAQEKAEYARLKAKFESAPEVQV